MAPGSPRGDGGWSACETVAGSRRTSMDFLLPDESCVSPEHNRGMNDHFQELRQEHKYANAKQTRPLGTADEALVSARRVLDWDQDADMDDVEIMGVPSWEIQQLNLLFASPTHVATWEDLRLQ